MSDKIFSLRVILKLFEDCSQERFMNIAGLFSPEEREKIEAGNELSVDRQGIDRILSAEFFAAKIESTGLSKCLYNPQSKKNEPIEVLFKSGFRVKVNVADDNISDAMIMAKASAIGAGHRSPKIAHIKDAKNNIVYYCTLCGENPVTPSEGVDICYNCANS